ncbi:hypothetical protein EV356DRAFT_16268 [Viridothelium virens]|uniref:Arrestin-like N-terminal domain-containing protein n=1 Tax=Viridothelium virens TaxID=1048519 RepID=A0A6A6HIT4_VIRVR|nr:hypothetical protein EV356DRAFT_16268 [Viridothelium virens]
MLQHRFPERRLQNMPLFRPSDDVKALVQIELDQPPQHLYHPGSRVSGRVVLQSTVEEFVEQVTITLQGHNDTYIEDDDTSTRGGVNSSTTSTTTYRYQDQTPLFIFRQTLFVGNKTCLRGQRHVWPFSFDSFPSMTDNDRTFPYRQATDDLGAWLSCRHLLPPNFDHERSTSRKCSIVYSVEAHVICTAERKHPDLVGIERIRFVPFRRPRLYRLPLQEFVRTFDLPASRLLSEKRSLRTRLNDTFSSDALKYKITLKSSLSSEIVPGEPFSIFCALVFEDTPEPMPEICVVHFELTRLQLRSMTMYRGPRVSFGGKVHDRGYRNELSSFVEDRLELACDRENGQAEKLEDQLKWLFRIRAVVPDTVCPSFQSFSISLGHRLAFTIVAEIGGKKHELKGKVRNSAVVSPFEGSQRLVTGQPTPPPAYEEVMGESSKKQSLIA